MNRFMCWNVNENGLSYRGWIWAATGDQAEAELSRRIDAGELDGLEIFDRVAGRYIQKLEG